MQAEVARDYVSSQGGAEGKDVSVIVADWLSPSSVQEQFDVGYDYTCATQSYALNQEQRCCAVPTCTVWKV